MNFMNIAIKEAKKSYKIDDVPVGAVIVKDDVVIAKAHNMKEKKCNAIMHAEIIAIDKACKKLKRWRLDDCELYVTMEPCIMCSGAIVNSRIKNIIIGTKHIKNANIEKQHTFEMEYFKDSRVNGEFGIMEDECSIILQRFFKELRKK